MTFLHFKQALKDFPVFSLSDIKKVNPTFHRQRLTEWVRDGHLTKIRNGYYAFADTAPDESYLCVIANRIYSPSYVSLEFVLSLYGFIPEGVYVITSVTSQKTAHFKTVLGYFDYRYLNPKLLFGYKLVGYNGVNYKIAEPEKALLDYFYFHPGIKDEESFAGLRLNIPEIKETVDLDKLQTYLLAFSSSSLNRRVKRFLKFLNSYA